MEIEIGNENMIYIIIGIVIIAGTAILYTELGILSILITIIAATAGIWALAKMQKTGSIGNTSVIRTQIKNYFARKRIRNPKMKKITEKEYKEQREREKKKKWKINW